MENTLLQQLGLSVHQITVYGALLEGGPQKAGALAKHTPLKRGLVYKTLEDLVALDLVGKDVSHGAVAVFSAKHPSALKDFADKKARVITRAQNTLENELGRFISAYNLATGKPGVEFYEGAQGVERVLADSLTSSEEIYAYVDSATLDQKDDFIKAERDYVKNRLKYGIKKKILMVDSPEARTYAENNVSELTKIRILSQTVPPFGSAMEIYDNRISYITFHNDITTGTLIFSKPIYEMHRAFFDVMWSKSRSF